MSDNADMPPEDCDYQPVGAREYGPPPPGYENVIDRDTGRWLGLKRARQKPPAASPPAPSPAGSDNLRMRAKHVAAFAACQTEADRQRLQDAYTAELIHLSPADRAAIDQANTETFDRLQGAAA